MQECEKLIMVQANDSERSKYIKDSMTNDKRLDAISKEKQKLKSDQWIRVENDLKMVRSFDECHLESFQKLSNIPSV
ncbi:unnamed protein product [Rhizophagus irregularis]|nr:unnamed protein product [Rhizophagus irregularis]